MRIKSIVFYGKTELYEKTTIAVKHEYLLVKPLYVYLSVIEKILYSGYEPLLKPVIPGSSGVVRILEDPSGKHSDLSGRLAIVSPIGKYGILGLDEDGLLSSYSSIHPSYIYRYVEEAKAIYSLYPYIAYSINLGIQSAGLTVIIGCDIVEIGLAYYIINYKGEKPIIICSNIPRYLRSGKLRFYKHVSDLPDKCNTIVLGYDKYSLIYSVLNKISTEKILITCYSRLKLLPLRKRINIRVSYIDSIGEVDPGIVEDIARSINRYVRKIKTKDIEELPGLLPPRKMGIIVEF